MLAEIKLKLWAQEMQPIEAYPVLFYLMRPYPIAHLTKINATAILYQNIIYKN